jgi:hypothetical protein
VLGFNDDGVGDGKDGKNSENDAENDLWNRHII